MAVLNSNKVLSSSWFRNTLRRAGIFYTHLSYLLYLLIVTHFGYFTPTYLEIDLVDAKRVNHPNISHKIGKSILEQQGGKFLQGIGKLSSKVSRNIVYDVGKFIGMKFKPWGAFKAAKFIRGLGPVFAVGGVIFDAAMTAKEEQEQQENQRKLLGARAQVREEFKNLAEEMRQEYESNIEEALILYDEELNDTAFPAVMRYSSSN